MGNLFPTLQQGGLGFNAGMEFIQERTEHRPDLTQLHADQLGFTETRPASKYRREVHPISRSSNCPSSCKR